MLKRSIRASLFKCLLWAGCLVLGGSALAETPLAEQMLRAAHHLRMGEGDAALAIWKPLAERGQVDAQFNLGTVYLHGDGVAKNEEAALKWFRLAAEQGDRGAQQQLGVMILNGQGTVANAEEGYRWINRKHHEHWHHAQHMEPERQRAAQLLWREQMQESYRKNSGEQGAQVIAELRRRAGMSPAGTELASR